MKTRTRRSRREIAKLRFGLLVAWTLSLVACGGEAEDGGSGGSAATGGNSGSGLPHGIDCSACSEQQVCWYTLDYDGSVDRVGCLALPVECPEPADCDCINTVEEQVCDQVGWVQNGNACSTHDSVAVVECISTLG